jgi:alkylhydroperoxidase/carboxymuconolactone decarboxylase family protein YurZ
MENKKSGKANNTNIVSKPLKLINIRPGALEMFLKYRDQILDKGPLTEKERFLVALATTVALKSSNCIRTQTTNARKAGASEDEIVQTMLIVGLVSGNSPLNAAYETGALDQENL